MISPVKIWRNQKHISSLLNCEGKIISYTVIRVPPAGFETQAPYLVALVKSGNKNLIGQLVDVDINKIKIGQKVKIIIRKVRETDAEGIIPYGIKFKITNY